MVARVSRTAAFLTLGPAGTASRTQGEEEFKRVINFGDAAFHVRDNEEVHWDGSLCPITRYEARAISRRGVVNA